MTRRLEGLQSATPCSRPPTIPQGRARGAKAAGLRYEKDLLKTLKIAFPLSAISYGQWFSFTDTNGPGYCQPDILLPLRQSLVILEAKYSWVPEAHLQIERLYRPICQFVFQRLILGVVVTRRVTPGMGRVCVTSSIEEAVLRASEGYQTVLHWLPGTPIQQSELKPKFSWSFATERFAVPELSP